MALIRTERSELLARLHHELDTLLKNGKDFFSVKVRVRWFDPRERKESIAEGYAFGPHLRFRNFRRSVHCGTGNITLVSIPISQLIDRQSVEPLLLSPFEDWKRSNGLLSEIDRAFSHCSHEIAIPWAWVLAIELPEVMNGST